MEGNHKASGLVQILIAVIGVVGSLGVAWMTTQAKFASELENKAAEITQLKAQLDSAERRLTQQQQEMDRKVAAVDERLRRLDLQIELAQSAAGGLMKAGGRLLGSKKSGD